MRRRVEVNTGARLAAFLFLVATLGGCGQPASDAEETWAQGPQSEWPQITMINEITYTDQHHPIAGCGFLMVANGDTLAATAKHVLTFFKSGSMSRVSFGGTLESWRMFPKNNPDDFVVLDRLINEDPEEPIDGVPSSRDWLLFRVKEKSPNIQPLELRETPMEPGERVYIVGWRYTDRDCPQVIYEGAFAGAENGTILVSTQELADNTMPGLSGAPVIDSRGRVVGLMSAKAGKKERLSSLDYPREVLRRAQRAEDPPVAR
jgi:hypothetical protein